MTPDDTLSKWENYANNSETVSLKILRQRQAALIKLVRAKDELIKYCLGPTRDVKTPKLQEALNLTRELR